MSARYLTCLISIGALISLSAFTCNNDSDSQDDQLARLESDIMALIAGAEASNVSACRVVAFGSKPCGGPWRYLVYSTEATDSTLLLSKVDRYNKLQALRNREEGLVSDCALAAKPSVDFVGGRCVAAE